MLFVSRKLSTMMKEEMEEERSDQGTVEQQRHSMIFIIFAYPCALHFLVTKQWTIQMAIKHHFVNISFSLI